MDTITVNGVEYAPVQKIDAEGRVVIRSRESGVHYGVMHDKTGNEVTLTNSRRLWFWSGAASLSELATHGVTNPDSCKFTVRVPSITILGVCEIIKCSAKAAQCIEEVPEWKLH